jgi:hypothetical protein
MSQPTDPTTDTDDAELSTTHDEDGARSDSTSPLPGINNAPTGATHTASGSEGTDSDTDAEADTDDSGSLTGKLLSPISSLLGRSSSSTSPDPLKDLSDDIKHFISPEGVSWKSNHTELGDLYSRTYTVSGWPKEAQAHLLYQLYTDPKLVYNASLHYDPFDRQEAIDHLAEIEHELDDKATGDFAQYLPNIDAVKQTLNIVRQMKVQVENEGRKLYQISIYITVYAQEKEQLEQLDRRIREQVTTGADLDLQIARDYPDEAHLSSSPLGQNAMADNREYATQLVLDKAAGMTFPLVDDTLVEPSGVIVGFNLANQTAVVLDIYERNNGYGKLVIGALGSGKSFSTGQYLIRHRIMHPEDNIIIIDPMGGFVGVNEAIGGEQITINGTETINPLEIKETPQEVLEATEQTDPYRMKLDEVRWFFKRFFDAYDVDIAGESWAPLNKAIKTAYRDKGITADPSTHSNPSPTINDVLDNLEEIAENPEKYAASRSDREIEKWEDNAASLLLDLQPFREGNELDNLVGQTDFEIDDSTPTYIDLQAYDGKQDSQGLMMRIVFSMLYEQVKDSDRRSIIAIDEAHKLIGDENSAEHWAEIQRHSRHHDLSLHLISQEFEDFFQSEDGDGANEAAKTLASLCTVRQIHRVNNVDRKLAKDGLGLTDDHIDFIENAVPGEEGRGYTTALLDVEDKGYVGLKVTATQNELAIVDYDPAESLTKDGVATPESDKIQRALEARGKLTGNINAPHNDELIQNLVNEIPIENLAPKVADLFIDRLIEDPDTQYTEDHRRMLSHAIKTQESITQKAPEFASAELDETARRIRVRHPSDQRKERPQPEPSTPDRTPATDDTELPWETATDEITPEPTADVAPPDSVTDTDSETDEDTQDDAASNSPETVPNPEPESPDETEEPQDVGPTEDDEPADEPTTDMAAESVETPLDASQPRADTDGGTTTERQAKSHPSQATSATDSPPAVTDQNEPPLDSKKQGDDQDGGDEEDQAPATPESADNDDNDDNEATPASDDTTSSGRPPEIERYPAAPEQTPTLEAATQTPRPANSSSDQSQPQSTPPEPTAKNTNGTEPSPESSSDTTKAPSPSEIAEMVDVPRRELAQEVPFWARKKLHVRALSQISDETIGHLTATIDSPKLNSPSRETAEETIAILHAREELEQGGKTATIDPVEQIQTTITANTIHD